MRERVLAIVSIIAQYVMEEQDIMAESDIVEELLAVGFEAEEIDAAFSWMENLSLQSRTKPAPDLKLPTHRVFTREETRALSPEARGFLVRMRGMGILDDDLQEEIMERILHDPREEIGLDEVKTLTALILFARSHDDWRREVDCILEDDWTRLYH